MAKTNGQEAKKAQKRTFAYACTELGLNSDGTSNFKINSKIEFNFKTVRVENGLKLVDGFFKGEDIDTLLNSDYYLIHGMKIKEDDYTYNDILLVSLYNLDYTNGDVVFKVDTLTNDEKKEVLFKYFKKAYLDNEIKSPYEEFNLEESVEKEFLFKYLYESLTYETSEKWKPLKDLIADMQFGKITTYKEIILNEDLNLDKMMEDFFKFIKKSRDEKEHKVIYNIYNHNIYDYNHYYPHYRNDYSPYLYWDNNQWNYTTTSLDHQDYIATGNLNFNDSLTVGTTGAYFTTSGDTLTVRGSILSADGQWSGTDTITSANSLTNLSGGYATTATTLSNTTDSSLEHMYDALQSITSK